MSALTRGPRSMITGTVGTVAVAVLGPNKANNYLRVHNPAGDIGTVIAVSYDGKTDPVIYGSGITIAPLSDDENAIHVPTAGVKIIGNAASCAYTIEWA